MEGGSRRSHDDSADQMLLPSCCMRSAGCHVSVCSQAATPAPQPLCEGQEVGLPGYEEEPGAEVSNGHEQCSCVIHDTQVTQHLRVQEEGMGSDQDQEAAADEVGSSMCHAPLSRCRGKRAHTMPCRYWPPTQHPLTSHAQHQPTHRCIRCACSIGNKVSLTSTNTVDPGQSSVQQVWAVISWLFLFVFVQQVTCSR